MAEKPLSNCSELELNQLIAKQAFIDRTADIPYQCFYLKITEKEFWRRYLWAKA